MMGLGLTSCDNDEFLDVPHGNILPADAIFDTDEAAIAALTGCYDLMLPSQTKDFAQNAVHNDDPFKPYIFTTSHPTMDSQASGWDKAFCVQGWNAQTTELLSGWRHAYAAISRCNEYLAGIETAEALTPSVRTHLQGEALALRSYQYHWLATTFGRVPWLEAGETYVNTPAKARVESHEKMWDAIIDDFKKASELLDWEPMNGEYGRCTKGMALAYLADSYMWKAYRTGDASNYTLAKAALKQIIDSGTYELNPSFSTLFDADEAWGKEAIWQEVLNEGDQWGGWDGGKWSEAHGWVGFYYGAPANGAWGTYAVSYELYDAYEDGDKRRDASLVTATLSEGELDRISALEGRDIKNHWKQTFTPKAWLANEANNKYIQGRKWIEEKKDDAGNVIEKIEHITPAGSVDFSDEGKNVISYNPDCPIGFNPFAQEWVNYSTFHREKGDIAPTVYSTKHWRNGRGTHWQGDQWLPDHIYMKRYANVLLDYAECCFRTNDAAEGWKYVNMIRNRAFGNLEVGKKDELTAKYNNYYKWLGTFYKGDNADRGFGVFTVSDEYPIPFNEVEVEVPDAETYYTARKAEMGFDSPVWQVAVNEERRKEFNAEWSLKTDIQKSGYLVDHMTHNYPKGYGTATGIEQIYTWRTYRGFDFDEGKMDMPIPQDELTKNPLCDQNEAYREASVE
ncbi:MAG: RagB/SusD family nutrient uptake outer membrane protein [Prevotella sp.]|nr:RagB/SusD family nutrient uptake outer membrane protein [Prevotella sp.]